MDAFKEYLMTFKDEKVYVPPAVTNGKLIIRGTKEWDDREDARKKAGCGCMSYGDLSESIATRGHTSIARSVF